MTPSTPFDGRNDHLKRLPRSHYQGEAMVHWSMTIDQRRIGWMTPNFHSEFREILIHTLFCYKLLCPIYCCMPDHFHLLWVGIRGDSDQWLGMRFFRKQVNRVLGISGFALQREAYDHVLREKEKEPSAFWRTVVYIAANPERAGLINKGGEFRYPYLGCVIPGVPELIWGQPDFFDRFWRIKGHLSSETDGRVSGN